MRRYRISHQAKRDLQDIRKYLSKENPAIVGKTFDAIQRTIELIAEQPMLGAALPELREGLRHAVPRRPANRYIVFYYVIEDGIEISDIIHQSRDWQVLFESGER